MKNEFPTVMFTGNVTHKLDPKSRVAVPAGWRAAHEGALLLIDAKRKGYPVVKCYTRASFAEMVDSVRNRAETLGAQPGEIDQYVGDIIGSSFEAEVSTQGKLLIPKQQRENLHLAETATLVGRGSYFEVWLPEDFAATNTPEAIGKSKLDQVFGILS